MRKSYENPVIEVVEINEITTNTADASINAPFESEIPFWGQI